MLQAKARWNIGQPDEQAANRLAEALSLPPLLARLLVARGITDIEHAASFLHGGTDQTHDPFLLDGMDRAVERIRRALEHGERIRVYGDYDADGVSSTTLMVHLLRMLGASFDYYIPHRVHEGYGLNCPALDAARERNVSLIITVDTGISAVDEIAYANSLGLDVIVTDHHEPPESLPGAYALINPKKPGCPYPYKHLAGVGVALKLAQALLGRWPDELLEFAAIGTVADLMLLTGENRLIVKQGLERMRSTSNEGIKALLEVSGIAVKEVNASHIGFSLAPRINASGRLLSADSAVRLLTTDSGQEAEQLASELDLLNKERQRIVEEMTKQATAMVEARMEDGGLPEAIVLAHEEWNVGVIGIVASKLVDRFYRPTVILGIDKETNMAKGSARSINGFDMYKALCHCQDLMDHYGGHQMAAGMSLHRDRLAELQERMCRLAAEWLGPEDWIPMIQADMRCDWGDVGLESIRQLELLGPFGSGNPSPKFVFSGLSLKELRTMGKEQQHLKLSLKGGADEAAAAVDAVGFNKGALAEWISPHAALDVLGELSLNEWNGVRRPQIMMQDLKISEIQLFDWRGTPRPDRKLLELAGRLADHAGASAEPAAVMFFSGDEPKALANPAMPVGLWRSDPLGMPQPLNAWAREHAWEKARTVFMYYLPDSFTQLDGVMAQAAGVERIYAAFGGTEVDKMAGRLPDRDQFKSVYGLIAALRQGAMPFEGPEGFLGWVVRRTGLDPVSAAFIVRVFEELGFIRRHDPGYVLVPDAPKKDLAVSALYQARKGRPGVEQELLYSTAKELAKRLIEPKHRNLSFLEEIL
ncbi:single-stranded-DNA-specific exonuclease RecJ [Paenibacillus filicis]|uniref:Single-stranded-DNA-specific exonuclease RecJ n=1 Tax=Paenibacillus gyeongsangnamensis TaxID=3388067 RepID=A0ABT4QCP2_9BACL|nr:single-stranded-DNA-specific exonuclease RecJ [Paenibacillus filicis]MCZ8514621.1 single-stranded-DNA-specific exonuclease RecJ [Paenibacillus filicis]